MIPYYPADTDSTGNHYVIETIGEHLVAHYANMTLPAVDDLLLDDYLLLLRDAFIARKLRTPDGCTASGTRLSSAGRLRVPG